MVSEATARLVEDVAVLDTPKMVAIKGAAAPVPPRCLLAMTAKKTLVGRRESTLVGRDHEMDAIAAVLSETIDGQG